MQKLPFLVFSLTSAFPSPPLFRHLRFSFFPSPRLPPFNTRMALAPLPLLQRQLDTTLQLFILLSSNMTADQIHMVRVHLTEGSVILGYILAERERNGVVINGKSCFFHSHCFLTLWDQIRT